ncbi:MAG: hypothetical protein M3277_11540, partial [Actinomycetota bacterium]|nr:hypothetical protein [Actinomycetota bacterium]
AALIATASCGDAGDTTASPDEAGNAAWSSEPAASKDCPYVDAEPTYLPWVPEGEGAGASENRRERDVVRHVDR